jgi:hypothetical protein
MSVYSESIAYSRKERKKNITILMPSSEVERTKTHILMPSSEVERTNTHREKKLQLYLNKHGCKEKAANLCTPPNEKARPERALTVRERMLSGPWRYGSSDPRWAGR